MTPETALATALTLRAQGRPDEAEALLDGVRAQHPDSPELATLAGKMKLLRGDYAAGWPLFDRRLELPYHRDRGDGGLPRWTGDADLSATLVVRKDEGYGDFFMCLRWLSWARQRVGRLCLFADPGLDAVVEGLPEAVSLLSGEEIMALEPPVLLADMFSLPRLAGATADTLPAPPYLTADLTRRQGWRPRLDAPGLKVGLVWQCSADHPTERQAETRRGMPLSALQALFRIPGVSFFSLQIGHGEEELSPLAAGHPLRDLGDGPWDRARMFADSAAIMAELDLVITVDTAAAHLAGALGMPVWVMLPFACDWRWMLERSDSPWYPSARLYRQSRAGQWVDVVGRIAADLRAAVKDGAALHPA